MPSVRDIVRTVLVVVCVVITLYLLWLLRKPISWLLIATFLAIALSPPVNWLAGACAAASPSRSSTSDCWRCRCC